MAAALSLASASADVYAAFEAADPVLLARRLGRAPDPIQDEILRCTAKEVLILCHRQWGKSTTAGDWASHTSFYESDALTLITAPTDRQSGELFRKAVSTMRRLITRSGSVKVKDFKREKIAWNREIKEATKRTLELTNGSRIVALPGSEDTIRGFSSPRRVIVDEGAMADDGLYRAVRPMLMHGGQLVVMSTPKGKRGAFHARWTAKDRAARFLCRADASPRVDPDWLAQERLAMADWEFRQEYLCEFVDTVDSVFRSEDIDRAIVDEVPLWG